MKRLSVVMSVFNGEQFLNQAIDSILGQSYGDFELILIDDCSTDNSRDIIQEYAESDSRIIPVYNTKNAGLAINLNKGIEMAKGEYIARMDADDLSLDSRFEKQLKFLESNPDIDLVGTVSVEIDELGNKINLRSVPELHEDIVSLLPKANPITHPTVIFRKKSFERINFYNEKSVIEDYDLWFRAVGAGLKLYNLQECLLHYRMGKNYVDRRSFSYRWIDFKLRLRGFKKIQLPYIKYYYSLIPIVLGLTPKSLYPFLKKIDPRVKLLNTPMPK